MPLSNELDEIGDEVRRVLPAGENLLAVTSVALAFGSTGRHDPDIRQSKAIARLRGVGDAIDRVKVPRWMAKGAVAAAGIGGVGPSWSPRFRLIRRWLGGDVVVGEPGRTARQLQAELPPYGFGRYLAVTGGRLLLLKAAPLLSRRSVSDEPPEWAAPRTIVATARYRPRVLARARFELTFTDGSRIQFTGYPPHFGGRTARQLVASLTGPQPGWPPSAPAG